MMAKAGRKRKSSPTVSASVKRHACGQIKRDDGEARQLSVILSQPHRRGSENPIDQKHESAFGRFCIRRKLKEEIYSAAQRYGELIRRWRCAKGVPTTLRLGEGGSGLGPSDETVARWGREIATIEHGILAECDPRGFLSIRSMILDEIDGDIRLDAVSQDAAVWLAINMGTISARDCAFP